MKKESIDILKVEELKNGYFFNKETGIFECIICGKQFKDGFVYDSNGESCIASKAIKIHIHEEHKGVLDFLLNLDKKDNGLNETQKALLKQFFLSKKDREISKNMNLSLSNIRNHRYRLRERYRQDKVFLAIMKIVELNSSKEANLITLTGKNIPEDDRSLITEREEEEALKKYFDEDGKILNFPKKQKKKLIILNKIVNDFKKEKSYSEKEVNEILKERFFDFVTLRRYMIEYGFLRRNKDGTDYRIKE